MKLFRFISFFLILVLAFSPILASVCATSCALPSTSSFQKAMSMDISSMDASHCKLMEKSTDHNSKHAKNNSCTMAGCHFSVAATLDFGHQDFAYNDTSNQRTDLNFFGLSAYPYPPIKPPA